jgi:hypothetical protein
VVNYYETAVVHPLIDISNRVDFETLLATFEQEVNLNESMPASLSGGELVAVRRYEVAAALSRLRGLQVV